MRFVWRRSHPIQHEIAKDRNEHNLTKHRRYSRCYCNMNSNLEGKNKKNNSLRTNDLKQHFLTWNRLPQIHENDGYQPPLLWILTKIWQWNTKDSKQACQENGIPVKLIKKNLDFISSFTYNNYSNSLLGFWFFSELKKMRMWLSAKQCGSNANQFSKRWPIYCGKLSPEEYTSQYFKRLRKVYIW